MGGSGFVRGFRVLGKGFRVLREGMGFLARGRGVFIGNDKWCIL